MFDFFGMADNYDERVVARYENGALIVDTCSVTDGSHPYETGISHPRYNNGKWVIVEAYDTKTDAKKGHEEWVKKMTAPKLPPSLSDCGNAGISQLFLAVGGEKDYPAK